MQANIALQASESRYVSKLQAKVAHDMGRCYFSTITFLTDHISVAIKLPSMQNTVSREAPLANSR